MVYGLDKSLGGRGARGFRRWPGFESLSRRGEHGRARSQVKGIEIRPRRRAFYHFVIFFIFSFSFSESINKTCDVHVDGAGQFHSPKEIMLSAVLT